LLCIVGIAVGVAVVRESAQGVANDDEINVPQLTQEGMLGLCHYLFYAYVFISILQIVLTDISGISRLVKLQ